MLPVQIFIWADLPERAFSSARPRRRSSFCSFSCSCMNGAAILLRKRFERRW